MKNDTFQDLANDLGLDRSTVSRAIRHCPGVDGGTRKKVLEAARQAGIQSAVDLCGVYCIMPDVPTYFWHTYHREIKEKLKKTGIPVRYSIYSKIYDSETVLMYLDDVIRSGARVLILTAVLSKEIREKLADIQKNGVYVILLSEYGELPNSTYVGANSYQDGERIGWWFCQRYPQHTPLILNNIGGNANISQRIDGFIHSLEQFNSSYAQEIPVIRLNANYFNNSRTVSAKYAALLDRMDGKYSCIYIPFGSIELPLSVVKAKKLTSIKLLFGHDCFTKAGINSLYPGYTASCNQNIAHQVDTAVELAASYINDPVMPDSQTFRFIESKVCSSSKESIV